jgi:hypothetical protein
LNYEQHQFVSFSEDVERLYDLFPNASPWLSWYMREKVATVLFPACSSKEADDRRKKNNLSTDTNAQESVGDQIQKCVNGQVGVNQCMEVCFNYCYRLSHQRIAALNGSYKVKVQSGTKKQTKRKRGKKKVTSTSASEAAVKTKKHRKKYGTSDYRAPDTDDLLLGKPDVFRGIRNGFTTTDGIYIDNTCSIDHVLSIIFIIELDRRKVGKP